MKLSSIVLVAALASCAPSCAMGDAPPPTVAVDLSGVREADRPNVMAGVRAWEMCGVTFADTDADIVVRIRSATVDDHIGYGWANPDTGEVILWSDMNEDTRATATHELGHVILRTRDHLDGVGVMSAPHSAMSMTAADRAFACDAAGLCCE